MKYHIFTKIVTACFTVFAMTILFTFGAKPVLAANTGQLTAEVWVKPTSSIASQAILGKSEELRIFTDASGYVGCQIKATTWQTAAQATTNALALNTWTQTACTYDKANIKVYVNGVLVATQAETDAPDDTADAFKIGQDDSASTPYSNFTGVVDNFQFYNYARSQKQIVEDMNAGHPAVGSPIGSPVLHWKFDEGYGTTTNNSGRAGSTLNGTISGATWVQNGKFGKAMNFSTNQSISKADHDTLDIGGDLTISAWVNFTDPYTSVLYNSYGTIAGKSSPGNWNQSYKIYAGRGTNDTTYNQLKYKLGFGRGTGSSSVDLISDDDYNDGAWHYVAGVQNMTDGKMYLYIDGKLKKSTANTGTITNTHTFYVGYEYTRGYYNGKIDEVKVYDYALTANEITTDYNRGSAMVLGALGNNSTYAPQAANQEYCVPGDSTSCAAPIGRWDFEEGTGTTVNDSSGNGYSGAITGATYKPGKYGKALKFAGGSDVVDAISSISSVKTVSFWVNPAATTGNFIDIQTTPGTINISASSGTVSATGFTSPSIYVNGVSAGTITANSWNHIEVTTGTAVTADALRFGRISTTSLTGSLDAVRLFDYAKSPAQAAWDYNRGSPVGWWKFDECQGATVNDSSGNGNSGTITPGSGGQTAVGTCTGDAGTMWKDGVSGKRNYSLDFDGTDDYVNIPDQSYLSPGSGNYSMSAWVKTSKNYSSAVGWIFSNYGSATNNVTQLVINTDNKLFCGFRDGSANAVTVTGKGQAVNDGNWHHVVCVRDGTTAYSYVNGVQIGSAANASLGTINTTGRAKTIGVIATNYVQPVQGQIDDVKVYNYALTATQVKDIMNEGAIRYGPLTGSP